MSTPDPLPPRRTGVHKVDLLVGGCALLASLLSLFIAWRSNQTQERMLAASVWPYLSWNDSNTDEQRHVDQISFAFDNSGVGPAKVQWVTIGYQGRLLKNGSEVVKACCKEEQAALKNWRLSTGWVSPSVIPAHDHNQFFALERTAENAPVWDKLNHERFNLEVHVCYCSVLDECWLLDAAKQVPEPVRSCPAPPEPQFH